MPAQESILAQVIITLDSTGALRIEAPGRNGMRAKIEGIALHDLRPELVATLLDQRDRAIASAAHDAALRSAQDLERAKRIWSATLRAHGAPLANRVIPPERRPSVTRHVKTYEVEDWSVD